MFLNERAQQTINRLRNANNGGVDSYKASISDAMSIITDMYESHANTPREKEELINALSVLSEYNNLLTVLSKEK